jgi:hypothetical protein
MPLTESQVREAVDAAANYLSAASYGGVAIANAAEHLTDTVSYAATVDTTVGMRGTTMGSATRLISWIEDIVDDVRTDRRSGGAQITGIQVRVRIPTFTVGSVRVKD